MLCEYVYVVYCLLFRCYRLLIKCMSCLLYVYDGVGMIVLFLYYIYLYFYVLDIMYVYLYMLMIYGIK